jgi:glycosyltransferase involved in cell wall biosynthesis
MPGGPVLTMPRLRVAVIADLLEEQWPSMDLVADMLMDRLRSEHGDRIDATLVRPPLRRRATWWRGAGASRSAFTIDRFVNRFYDYPRALRGAVAAHDVFHVVDHSYAQMVHALPAGRTVVTCHDLDTFRSVLDPGREPRSAAFRAMTRRILDGVRRAGHVACDTEATRDRLVTDAGVDPARTSVVLNGPHPSCTPDPEPDADAEAGRRLAGATRSVDLLHVGSTIARKRIDVLLRVFAGVRAGCPSARLVRVGGPLTADQRALARELGVDSAIVVLPFLDRSTLAAVYRRSALVLLPSEREGFGLPMLEALACGTPVVASDIEALREVGGTAAIYCPPDDLDAWVVAVTRALAERRDDPARWRARQRAGTDRAAAFSWSRYATDLVAIYERLAAAGHANDRAVHSAGTREIERLQSGGGSR